MLEGKPVGAGRTCCRAVIPDNFGCDDVPEARAFSRALKRTTRQPVKVRYEVGLRDPDPQAGRLRARKRRADLMATMGLSRVLDPSRGRSFNHQPACDCAIIAETTRRLLFDYAKDIGSSLQRTVSSSPGLCYVGME